MGKEEIKKVISDLEIEIRDIENTIDIYKQKLRARKFELKEFKSCLT